MPNRSCSCLVPRNAQALNAGGETVWGYGKYRDGEIKQSVAL
ncbi:hypothetical protein SF123566_4152 [Shigella flexneri 1235-66]|nr:hypothetical protein SF123566_4152 [Shigella flexneri 1235-66]